METIGNIDSKFRFVILASKRAKQLLKGAKPKIKSRSHNLIRIAQQEVKNGAIEFEIIPLNLEEEAVEEERVLVGGEGGGAEVEHEAEEEAEGAEEETAEAEVAEEEEGAEDEESEEEDEEGLPASEDEDK